MPLRNESHEKRFEIAEEYIKRFARARLVITSRIHTALPCIALGTPVLLVFPKYDALRYGKLIDLLNYVGICENKVVYKYNIQKSRDTNHCEMTTLRNPQDYLEVAQKLSETVTSFLATPTCEA